MNKFVSIEPWEHAKTTVITNMSVRVLSVELFQSATLHVMLMDVNKNIVDSRIIYIAGDDFTNWDNNDDFIYTYVSGKLGLSISEKDVVIESFVSVTDE